MCRVLASLRDQVLPRSGQQFAVMAEGPLDPISRFHKELEQYRRSLPNRRPTRRPACQAR